MNFCRDFKENPRRMQNSKSSDGRARAAPLPRSSCILKAPEWLFIQNRTWQDLYVNLHKFFTPTANAMLKTVEIVNRALSRAKGDCFFENARHHVVSEVVKQAYANFHPNRRKSVGGQKKSIGPKNLLRFWWKSERRRISTRGKSRSWSCPSRVIRKSIFMH